MECVNVAKARVRVLSHRVDKQVEGVALQGGHMTLVCTIVIPINWNPTAAGANGGARRMQRCCGWSKPEPRSSIALKSIPLRTSEICPHSRYLPQPGILLPLAHSPRRPQKIGTSRPTCESKAKIQSLNIVLITFRYRSVKPVHHDISL
jgi:hypothetical protein